MRRTVLCLVLLLGAAGCPRESAPTSVAVYFSPRGGCTDAIVAAIAAARSEILVQAYSFTSAPIAKALADAQARGVKVQVVLDSGQKSEKYSSADFLVHHGIATRFDDKHAIAHNKVMVIDGATVVTGSFNFTKSAENSNAENLLVIRDPQLAARYAANWREHAEHSEPYRGREAAASDPPEDSGAEAEPAEKPDAGPAAFVASANSAVFHRPACRSVAKIAPRNLMPFVSREDAVRAGKKPCAECQP